MSPGVARLTGWRRELARGIVTVLVVKLVALVLLRTLFFSGEHRPEVTPRLVDEHLGIPADAAPLRAGEEAGS